MEPWKRIMRYFVGTVALLAAAAFILTVFRLLGRTEMEDMLLGEDAEWRYELLSDGRVRSPGPEMGAYDRVPLPEGTEAVRITRVMTEQIPDARLMWLRYQNGIEVFLDGEPLHSDFPGLVRDDSGFVAPTAADWERLFRGQPDAVIETRTSLPPDYTGKELSITTYSPECVNELLDPVYPYLGCEFSPYAPFVVASVRDNAIMTIYAIMTLLLVGLYLLDARNEHADSNQLLLSLFFLLLFLNKAYCSYAGSISILTERLNFRILIDLHMTPLYFYLALRLKRWWKWPLCAGVAAWSLYEAIRQFRFLETNPLGSAIRYGWEYVAVMLVIAAAYLAEDMARSKRSWLEKQRLLFYWLAACVILAVYMISRSIAWGGLGNYLTDGIWLAVSVGSFEPVLAPITNIIAAQTVIVVVTETIRRIMETRRTLSVFRERRRLVEENYRHMELRLRDTALMRHEWKNQVAALHVLTQKGDLTQLEQTLSRLDNQLTELSHTRYSENFTINILLQNASARAAQEGIDFHASAQVPPELAIEEQDLCVLLLNLLDNALLAASKCPAGQGNVHIGIRVNQGYLAIRCINSYIGPLPLDENGQLQTTKSNRSEHGFGLLQIRKTAKKYRGMFDISYTQDQFTAAASLKLP